MYKFLIPLFALALLIGCGKSPIPSSETPPVTPPPAMQQTSSAEKTGFDGKLLAGLHTVVLKTNKGDVTIELNADKAPKAVTNFVVLSRIGYFKGLTFHRVVPGFMIQGGDPKGDGTGGASIFGESFADEQSDLQMVKGAVAMANRGPNTNGSQFFIITASGTPWLQGRHTVFGRVTAGMDVVEAIMKVDRNGSDRPNEPVTFTPEVRE